MLVLGHWLGIAGWVDPVGNRQLKAHQKIVPQSRCTVVIGGSIGQA